MTAVEIRPEIAAIYQDFFPNDRVIVGDAHQYLQEHYAEFDFIWSSPPCQSHSKLRGITCVARRQSKPVYFDAKLWQEIIFLKTYCKKDFVVENVIPYYKPLIARISKFNGIYSGVTNSFFQQILKKIILTGEQQKFGKKI